MDRRLRVGVIFGGRSVEHDVSIITAHQIMEVLAARHEVVPIYITREGRWLSGPGLNDIDVYKAKRWDEVAGEAFIAPRPGNALVSPRQPARKGLFGGRGPEQPEVTIDVVVPAIHGTFGEDGTLQGVLEMSDIPYTGSGVLASAVGLDKNAMKNAFRAAGLPVVDDVTLKVEDFLSDGEAALDRVEQVLGYPVFVKPFRAGSSVGIAKATDRASLTEAIEVARRYDTNLLVERSMEGCIEVNCSVLGGAGHPPKTSVCEQPVRWEEFLSFQDKYMRSGKGGGAKGAAPEGSGSKSQGMASLERKIPAPIPDEVTERIQANALGAFEAIGASGVARIDSFVNEQTGETWVMEINTMPGSFAFYLWEASGVSFPQLADDLIDIAVKTHKVRSELLFSFESGLLDSARRGKTGG